MIHLIAGSTGAGKTFYSRQVALELKATVFSIDDLMKTLFWPEMPKDPDIKWFQENADWYRQRIERCENLVENLIWQGSKNGLNYILDLGFATAAHRKKFIAPAIENHIPCETHFLAIDKETRWARVETRNQEKPDTFAMHVDKGMFDYMESIFEEPTPQEGVPIKIISD